MSVSIAAIAAGVLAALFFAGIGFVLLDNRASRARSRMKKAASTPEPEEHKSLFGSLFDREPQTAVDRFRAVMDEQKRNERANIRLRLMQAGLTSSPAGYFAIYYAVGAVLGGAIYVFSGNLIFAALVAVVACFLAPSFLLQRRINARIQQFNEHFPGALDAIVRGVRGGMPVNESLKLVATEIPAPVGPEIERVVASVSLGQTMDEALQQLALRVPSQEVNFFRTVLSIQQKTGGNLAEALHTLSTVLRERKKMKSKVRALSSEARMSAIIIGSLPFLVGVLVYFLRPDYIGLLFTDPRGPWLVGGGLIWMSCGILMMRSMVRFEV